MTLTTSRKCPQCGKEVTPTARFCAECGSSMTPPGVSSTPSTKPPGSPGFGMPPPLAPTVRADKVDEAATQKAIMGVLIGAVVLLSVMVAVLAVMLRHATVASSQPCVYATALAPAAPPGAGEAHLPSAASLSPAPGTDGSAGTVATPASADITGYLGFLQGIEQKRVSIMTGQPAGGAAPDGNDPQTQLQALMSQFQARQFPEAFTSFAQEYMTFLEDCGAAEGKGPDQMASLSTEAGKLDGDLSRICTAQRVIKPFTIAMAGTAPSLSQTPTSTEPSVPPSSTESTTGAGGPAPDQPGAAASAAAPNTPVQP